MFERRFRARLFLLVTLTSMWLGGSACYSWTELASRPPLPAQLAANDHVWLTLEDGNRIELHGYIRIVGDSLVGTRLRTSPYPQGKAVDRRAAALADITTIRGRKTSWSKILLLAGGIWGGAALVCVADGCGPEFKGHR